MTDSLAKQYPWRFIIVLTILGLLVVLLIVRVVTLSLIDRKFLERQGNARAIRTIEIPAYRGLILDRNGHPLAISTPVYAISINPEKFMPTYVQLKTLAHVLNMSTQELSAIQKSMAMKKFMYLKRHVTPKDAETIKSLAITGLNFEREYQRYYPEGEVTAQLLGFTNIDDHGIEGLELAYDRYLHGEVGKKQVVKNLHGDVVSEVAVIKPPRAGHALTLSIDRRLQYLVYHALKEALEKYKAKAGNAVMLDVKTGEILALVNQPSYNPNDRSGRDPLNYRNQVVTDIFEPGSTIKPLSILNAMEAGGFKPDSTVDTSPGVMRAGSGTVRDLHDRGVINLSQILEVSSNIGTTKLTLALSNPHSLYQLLTRFGFGTVTESNFPGERSGTLVKRKNWPPFALATLSFGYGVSTTTLQLAQAYATIANHGKRQPVTLLKSTTPLPATQVVAAALADDVLMMLENVVSRGSGKAAAISGYRIAGKTGTIRTIGKHGYNLHSHEALFVGIAPVSQPRIVLAIIIKEPTNMGYYGSQVAAPVFGTIVSSTLRMLNIRPDAAVATSGPETTLTPQVVYEDQ